MEPNVRQLLQLIKERLEMEAWQLHMATNDAANDGDEQLADLVEIDQDLMMDAAEKIGEAIDKIGIYLTNNGKPPSITDTMWEDFADFAERYQALSPEQRDEICGYIFSEPHEPAHTQNEAAIIFEELMRGNVDVDFLRPYFRTGAA